MMTVCRPYKTRGELVKAVQSFRRYIQLAPNASDVDEVKTSIAAVFFQHGTAASVDDPERVAPLDDGRRTPVRAIVGVIRFVCAQPSDVRIMGVGDYKIVTERLVEVPPGDYRVLVRRSDRAKTKVTSTRLTVRSAETTSAPCD